jgi:cytochrome b subunit of formate dehydrogenase
MSKKNELPAIVSLAISVILAVGIILWPIYFFGFSTIKIIEMELSALIYFSTVEVVLIVAIIALWFAHKKLF